MSDRPRRLDRPVGLFQRRRLHDRPSLRDVAELAERADRCDGSGPCNPCVQLGRVVAGCGGVVPS